MLMVHYIWATLQAVICHLIFKRVERAKGNRVLMVSGSDEHGTPITVTAETQGISPQAVVDMYHEINTKALMDLGCSWEPNIDPRGPEYGGSLFNRTSDHEHYEIVSEFHEINGCWPFRAKSNATILRDKRRWRKIPS